MAERQSFQPFVIDTPSLGIAIALFTFELDPWPTACMVSIKTIDGKKVDSAVCINGKCLPYKSLSIPNGGLFSQ
ncbi:hypothetical protein Lepto7375DRAFT_6897 [Leptolyngbya sp. PCC 7375]|nr:hypothetical protein Lepto7375DRAFT_6897 [Leptolyngbya sp. PCC 7375]